MANDANLEAQIARLLNENARLKKVNHSLRTQLCKLKENKAPKVCYREQIRHLFFNERRPIKQIKESVGCSLNTVYKAIKIPAPKQLVPAESISRSI